VLQILISEDGAATAADLLSRVAAEDLVATAQARGCAVRERVNESESSDIPLLEKGVHYEEKGQSRDWL
jgi:hypothetical protein